MTALCLLSPYFPSTTALTISLFSLADTQANNILSHHKEEKEEEMNIQRKEENE